MTGKMVDVTVPRGQRKDEGALVPFSTSPTFFNHTREGRGHSTNASAAFTRLVMLGYKTATRIPCGFGFERRAGQWFALCLQEWRNCHFCPTEGASRQGQSRVPPSKKERGKKATPEPPQEGWMLSAAVPATGQSVAILGSRAGILPRSAQPEGWDIPEAQVRQGDWGK
jgi:hypothetical protein